ncbi:mannose-1-phosphate guanylyltransferase [Solicola gregarius]|uniref:NDP-sugar synthase n=1 Tax=Solicola gregarius TaxID=2908642 RepID=A0AA46YJX5_9ACTN|nr:NDP-sugar synthase [Solicola gregarius]UYM04034.1 NDP-sugar synthase [Solicola gregarius]
MRAIIIAGGFGSRLRPLTTRHPKHVLPVAGVPFLMHQISKLADADITEVVLAASYRADQFEPIVTAAKGIGVTVRVETEDHPLGTGGAIRHAAESMAMRPDEGVVVLNGDQLSGHSIALQAEEFAAARADVSLHLVEVADPRAYGCVPTDDAGRVTAFLEKSPDPVTNQINAGCYVFRRSVIDAIPAGAEVSVERETFPELLRSGAAIIGHVEDRYWLDVGTPEALVQASRDIVTGAVRTPAYPYTPSERYVESGAEVHSRASVRGGSAVSRGARLGANARVDGSVVMGGAVIADGAAVIDSVVGPGARVGMRTTLRGTALGDDAMVGADCELTAGARVACGATIPDGAIRFSSG